MKKKSLKPTAWGKYPTEDLLPRGDKVVQSNFKENLAIIGIVVLASLAIIGLFLLF